MKRQRLRRIPLLLIIATCGLAVSYSPALAATVVVPPVTITQLTHGAGVGMGHAYVSDYVTFSATGDTTGQVGYTSSGFTATILSGDTVVVRIRAPQGKKFVVHGGHGTPESPELFASSADWYASDGISFNPPIDVALEDFKGTPPTRAAAAAVMHTNGTFLSTWAKCEINGDFEFTAIRLEITVTQPITPTPAVFRAVQSISDPSFWVVSPLPDATLMEIVDSNVVPTTRSSWGQVKLMHLR